MNTSGSVLQEEAIIVSGMSCAGCAGRIERSLNGKEGVKNVKVNLAEKKVTVTYDKSMVSLNEIEALIEENGYAVVRTQE